MSKTGGQKQEDFNYRALYAEMRLEVIKANKGLQRLHHTVKHLKADVTFYKNETDELHRQLTEVQRVNMQLRRKSDVDWE